MKCNEVYISSQVLARFTKDAQVLENYGTNRNLTFLIRSLMSQTKLKRRVRAH